MIARIYDIEGKNSQAAIKLFRRVGAAQRTNLIEEGGQPLNVANGNAQFRVGRNAIETVKLNLK